MFCSKCGKEINDEAVVCIHCGCPTANYEQKTKEKEQPIIINNNNSASSSAAAAASAGGRVRRKYSLLLPAFHCTTKSLQVLTWRLFYNQR